MRVLYSLLPVLLTLIYCLFAAASPAGSSNGYSYPSPIPPLQHDRQFKPQPASRPWHWIRDSIIKTIWGVPERPSKPSYLDHLSTSDSSAPSKLLARYGGDVVLRFKISTSDEIDALAEASNILFLDVWASTDDWVDIRIAKDVVGLRYSIRLDEIYSYSDAAIQLTEKLNI